MLTVSWPRRFSSLFALALLFSGRIVAAQAPAPPAEPSNAETPNPTPAATEAASAPDVANAEPAAPAQPTATVPAATAATATPASNATDSAADAEAAAIEAELNSGGASESSSESKLSLYGFADFAFSVPIGDSYDPYVTTFAVGNLNLYMSADLGDDWRSLSEIRFMYLPGGSTPSNAPFDQPPPPRIDTSVADYTDIGRPVKWGGISIERAWLEHTFHPLLTVRAGQWLTPYGIWNVDHGSPVIIGVRRPFIVGESLFPQHQTGIETYGSVGFGPSVVGYHLTLSNGRGPIDSYKDLDSNKAIGARLFYKYDGDFGVITVGASGYRGKYTDSYDALGVDAAGNVTLDHPITVRYDELSLAADAKWEWQGLLVQGEAIINDVAYDDRHRPKAMVFDGGPPGFSPDHRKLGVYGITGYRTPFLGIMPWVGAEYYRPGIPFIYQSVAASFVGFNVRPTPRVVLKGQWTHVWVPSNEPIAPFNYMDFQAAWSF
jgi:hypothetical protein